MISSTLKFKRGSLITLISSWMKRPSTFSTLVTNTWWLICLGCSLRATIFISFPSMKKRWNLTISSLPAKSAWSLLRTFTRKFSRYRWVTSNLKESSLRIDKKLCLNLKVEKTHWWTWWQNKSPLCKTLLSRHTTQLMKILIITINLRTIIIMIMKQNAVHMSKSNKP